MGKDGADRGTTREEARRGRGWGVGGRSVGRISCLVSFTVPRCVMTVEWIIISLSSRPSLRVLVTLAASRSSLLRAFSSNQPRLGVYPVRKLAPSTRVLRSKDMQSGMGRSGGWRWWSRRALDARGERQRRYEEVGREIKAEMFPFSVPLFPRPLLPTRSSFLARGMARRIRGRRGREKRGERPMQP